MNETYEVEEMEDRTAPVTDLGLAHCLYEKRSMETQISEQRL